MNLDNSKKKFRVAVINSHPIQYFSPLYAYINQSDDIEITALYYSDISVRGGFDRGFGQAVKWDVDLLAGYPYQFVGPKAHTRTLGGFFSVFTPQISAAVRQGGYDALILHGHQYAADLIAFAAAKAAGIPVLMHCETHLGLRRTPLRAALRRAGLSLLYNACDGALAIGTANAAYHRFLGVPQASISLFPYTVDIARFTAASTLSAGERNAMRDRLGVSRGRPVVLYASKLERRKHPDDLLRAASQLAREGIEFDVVIAGSGEMGPELAALAAKRGGPHVVFPGFVNQAEMPKLFGACDVFVLPAHDEPWGLIINEAMCAGLPVVTTTEVGCVPDLVHAGENGALFHAGHVGQLADALRPLLQNADLRRGMGAKSREIIAGWSYAQCVAGLRDALGKIEQNPRRHRRRSDMS